MGITVADLRSAASSIVGTFISSIHSVKVPCGTGGMVTMALSP